MPTVETIRVIVPQPQIVRITVTTTPVPVVVSVRAFRPVGATFTPYGSTPTTLNEVIAAGSAIGLWP